MNITRRGWQSPKYCEKSLEGPVLDPSSWAETTADTGFAMRLRVLRRLSKGIGQCGITAEQNDRGRPPTTSRNWQNEILRVLWARIEFGRSKVGWSKVRSLRSLAQDCVGG